MKQSISLKWEENMKFNTVVNGHSIVLDAAEESGGSDAGPRPKPLLMAALAGCTAMDVVSILKKMRVELEDFNIKVEGELREEHPKEFTHMHIIYEFKGNNLPEDKLKKAIELSQEKYCAVSATFKKAMSVTYELKII